MSNKKINPISLVLVLALVGFAQAEILLNPGFEAGLDSWKTWGSGSGSGAGGWFWSSAYGATAIEDSTAHSGNTYIEIGFWPPQGAWWGYCLAFQEHPVTEGKTYQISAWLRDGDTDGAPSLITEGGTLSWEWRTEAPTEGPDGGRSDLLDVNGDGEGNNDDKIHYRVDLTEEWTYFSAIEVAPPGAKGLTVIFGTPQMNQNVDIDNASFIEMGGKATGPDPADGSFLEQTWATLAWKPGDLAVSHNVYLGDDFDDVNDGTGDTFRGNQDDDFYVAGFTGYAFPDGFVNGTTYYWRIDEVNDAEPNSPWKGDVWSFTVTPQTAYIPEPADGAEFIDLNVQLTWAAGFEAKLHYIVFGEDFDEVNNVVTGTPSGIAKFNPGTLKLAKTYYWRVDESDGTETHKGEIWSFTTEGAVSGPNPANGAVGVKPSVTLRWDAGAVAASHEVYFGADANAVANATTASPEYKGPKVLGEESYDPGKLALNTTYYWRIDEINGVNPDSPWAGNVWSFTTGDYFVIDDFEIYDANDNQIWWAWKDGLGYVAHGTEPAYLGNGTGSAVGDENTFSYMEETIAHGGLQSMPLFYDNNKQGYAKYSEAELTLMDQRDWTEEGVAELSIWFRGDPSNTPERMYVAVSNIAGAPAVVYHGDPGAANVDIWTEWPIPLQDLANLGLNLTDVDSIAIGLGTQGNIMIPGGLGKMLFDDIRLNLPSETAEQ